MNWVEKVAKKSNLDRDSVEGILSNYGIGGPRPVPPRRRLQVEALHFAGVKNLQNKSDPSIRDFIPFTFSRVFGTPVTAIVSNGRNDAGKSSTLDILSWGLRGTSDVRSDIRKWLRQACVLIKIGDERILISWRVDDGTATGEILTLSTKNVIDFTAIDSSAQAAMGEQATASTEAQCPVYESFAPIDQLQQSLRGNGAFPVGVFAGDKHMKTVIGDFMLNRLGLESLTQWRRNSGAKDIEDGNQAEHGWALWSQALFISKPSNKSTIGETPNQATAVLNTFLATEWSATRNLAKAQKKMVDSELAGVRRRYERDAEARDAGVAGLVEERENIQAELDELPPAQVTAEQAALATQRVALATKNLTDAQRLVAETALRYGSAERALHAAESDLAALKEAAVTKRFWHSLKPSCCPRCDATVDHEQWAREQEGACSLCNNPIDDAQTDEDLGIDSDEEEALDPVELAEQRRVACEAEVETTSHAHDEATRAARGAETDFAEASDALSNMHGDPEQRQVLERRVAVLDGRIEERSTNPDQQEEIAESLGLDSKVLAAAESIAQAEAKSDFDAALAAVSVQITELGKELGMSNLESAELKGNAHLPVVRGGIQSNFGGLTDGERLRLKIAVVIALLDVGAESGLGRHPGFLMVDSIAREELNSTNGQSLLAELNRVATMYNLQIITGTAHTDLVDAVLPNNAVVRPLASGLMW